MYILILNLRDLTASQFGLRSVFSVRQIKPAQLAFGRTLI